MNPRRYNSPLSFHAGYCWARRTDRLDSARQATDPDMRAVFVKQAREWHRRMMARIAGKIDP